MGDVVQLPQQTKRSGAASDRGGNRSALILLFTGVRYQRMTDTAVAEGGGGAPTHSGASGKRKRKRG